MGLENWLLYLLAVIIATSTPGPSILLTLTHGVNYGLKAAAITALGCITATSIMAIVSALGLGALLMASEGGFQYLKWIGGGYLLWLGIKMFCNQSGLSITEAAYSLSNKKQAIKRNFYYEGILVSGSNPKAIVFFGALFPLFLDQTGNIPLQFTIMLGTFIPFSYGFIFGYACLAVRVTPWLLRRNGVRWFNKITGSIFIVLGIILVIAKR